jgi:hypothetical protein
MKSGAAHAFATLSSLILMTSACHLTPTSAVEATGTSVTVQSLIPADRLTQIKSSLPNVAYPALQQMFTSPDTIWYDPTVMKPSYQKSTGGRGFWGANANDDWFAGLAPAIYDTGRRFYDDQAKHWRFPFATTAGTDDSTNVTVVNFIKFPRDNGGTLQPLSIWTEEHPDVDAGEMQWNWIYPNQTTVGEVIFVQDGDDLLPSEVRIRTRFPAGWATNAFRPFPRAADLSAAIKARRPNFAQNSRLKSLVDQLDGGGALNAKGLHATGLTGTYDQDGFVDVLPDFGDAALVRDLLTNTTFASAFETTWKETGGQTAFAPTTAAPLSIVPNNYAGGVIEVSDASCMRCHKEGGRLIGEWYDDISLYGEIWGKDGIFSFQPFDESYYDQLALEGVDDNRHLNPTLQSMGVIEMNDGPKTGPFYDRK